MATTTDDLSRFFPNPSTDTMRTVDAHDELLASLERISAHNPPVHTCSTGWKFSGFYAGPTSIAYLFFRLSQIYPDLAFKNQSLLEWAEQYLDLGARVLAPAAPDPHHCGIASETLAHLALSAVLRDDPSLARQLCAFAAVINAGSEDGSNEWLYGRAGYLYFLRLCRSAFDPADHADTAAVIERTLSETVARILSVPQPWLWHRKEYLGAAHGTVGIICQVVLSAPAAAPKLRLPLSRVLDQQYASGNFPSSLPAGPDRLVQFCHGGPGFATSLRQLLPHFPGGGLADKMRRAVRRAEADVWRRGLLTKEPSLCHGIAGNALAFGGDGGDDGSRFRHFLSFMTTREMDRRGWMQAAAAGGKRDDFASLFNGEAGRAWVWAVADRDLPKLCIGYNDL